MKLHNDENGFVFDALPFKRHTRKTGDKVTAEQIKSDSSLHDTFKYPNKDKSIYYKYPSVAQSFTVDISGLTGQQIYSLCADSAIIQQQKDERALSIEAMQKRTEVTINVAELLNNKRIAATPEQSIEKNFDKLSQEARVALLKKLGAGA